jgi:hypothetical protein
LRTDSGTGTENLLRIDAFRPEAKLVDNELTPRLRAGRV